MFLPSGHCNIDGTFQECLGEHSKNDPLIVQNENCMNVQVRMFIECAELDSEFVRTIEVGRAVEALGYSSVFMK